MKKKNIIIILSLIILIIATVAGAFIYNNSVGVRLKKQLDIAQKFVLEMNYEQARIEFAKAIEIDQVCVEAYLGTADAYEGLIKQAYDSGDLETARSLYEEVDDILNRGFELTNDSRIEEIMGKLRSFYEDLTSPSKENDTADNGESDVEELNAFFDAAVERMIEENFLYDGVHAEDFDIDFMRSMILKTTGTSYEGYDWHYNELSTGTDKYYATDDIQDGDSNFYICYSEMNVEDPFTSLSGQDSYSELDIRIYEGRKMPVLF